MKKNGEVYYYHADRLGSIAGLSSITQALVNRYAYYAYGRMRSKVEAIMQPYKYIGRENIINLNLFYYRSRILNIITGRFTREDDWWKELITMHNSIQNNEINWYYYVSANPINYIDNYGLDRVGAPIFQEERKYYGVRSIFTDEYNEKIDEKLIFVERLLDGDIDAWGEAILGKGFYDFLISNTKENNFFIEGPVCQ